MSKQHKLTSPTKTNFFNNKPRIHRRKPLPWDVHRSLKKDYVQKNNITLEDPIPMCITPTQSPEGSPQVTSTEKMATLSDLHMIACSMQFENDTL